MTTAVTSKQERRAHLEVELGAKQRALPDRRYGVIYADPPSLRPNSTAE